MNWVGGAKARAQIQNGGVVGAYAYPSHRPREVQRQQRTVPLLQFAKDHIANGDVLALQLSHQMEIDLVRQIPYRSTSSRTSQVTRTPETTESASKSERSRSQDVSENHSYSSYKSQRPSQDSSDMVSEVRARKMEALKNKRVVKALHGRKLAMSTTSHGSTRSYISSTSHESEDMINRSQAKAVSEYSEMSLARQKRKRSTRSRTSRRVRPRTLESRKTASKPKRSRSQEYLSEPHFDSLKKSLRSKSQDPSDNASKSWAKELEMLGKEWRARAKALHRRNLAISRTSRGSTSIKSHMSMMSSTLQESEKASKGSGSHIPAMSEKSQMSSTSQEIEEISNSSQMEVMSEKSQIEEMAEKSQIEEMPEKSQTEAMFNTSQTEAIFDKSQTEALFDKSQTGAMSETEKSQMSLTLEEIENISNRSNTHIEAMSEKSQMSRSSREMSD